MTWKMQYQQAPPYYPTTLPFPATLKTFFRNDFENITYIYNESLHYMCNQWTYTNDFIFTVVLIMSIRRRMDMQKLLTALTKLA